MMKRLILSVALLGVGSLLAACSAATTNTSPTSTTSPANKAAAVPAGSLKDPKSSIAYQFELVKAGDLDNLKACMTPRVRDGVTQEVVDKAKIDAAKYTIDELYDSAEFDKKTAKIKMKNGRTLTTLVETDGQWLADTIWFK